MGLDVYLIRDSHKRCEEREKEEEKGTFDYEKWKEERQTYTIEIPSTKYPEHLFKIGYFRSSYNNAGFNSAMSNHSLPTLYDIFKESAVNEYLYQPDWKEIVNKVDSALTQYDAKEEEMNLVCFNVPAGRIDYGLEKVKDPEHEAEAMASFMEEKKKYDNLPEKDKIGPFGMDAYSNYKGRFHLREPLEIYGLLSGKDFIGQPCIYVIAKSESNIFYRQAYEIVKETAEWVLSQPETQSFHLHWSG